jgi:SAM-dependent methyltransferase
VIRCPDCSEAYAGDRPSCPACGFAPSMIDGFPAWAPELAREGGGFHPEYFEVLAALEGQNFWFRSRNALLVGALRRHVPDLTSFMEVGCGTGFVLAGIARTFPDARLVGSEIFPDGLRFAAQRLPGTQFLQMDARKVPFEAEFDAVGAFDVIEHIEEDEAVLHNLAKATKPGGSVLITVPQHQFLWSEVDVQSMHVRRYSAPDLHARIKRAGLEIVYSTSFVSLLLPLMYLSRRRAPQGETYDPTRELRIAGPLNAALTAVMGIERGILATGITLPLGGSRLVVARKP